MKKLTAILLTLCMCMVVVGCGDSTGTEKKAGGTTPAPSSAPKSADKGK